MTSDLVWRGLGRTVPIELRPSAALRARLSLRADPARGVIRVGLHPRASAARALAFVAEQDAWITAHVARWPMPRPFVAGAMIPVEGRDTLIDWSAAHPRRVSLDDNRLIVGGPLDAMPARIERFLRDRAKTVLTEETLTLKDRVDRKVESVSVRDTSSRWGSCTGRGRIAYSWRLILAPVPVRQSVVAHEVAHLVHMNHGADFWSLTADLYDGDLEQARRWLKRHGASLHWVGRSA